MKSHPAARAPAPELSLPVLNPPVLSPLLRRLASASLLTLLVLCVVWEWRLGSPWLALKAVPLLAPLAGVVRGRIYTYQWAAMLSLLYVMEGAVRVSSDLSRLSVVLAGVELLLALTFFCCAIFYVRPAKQAKKQADAQHLNP